MTLRDLELMLVNDESLIIGITLLSYIGKEML